MPPATTDLPQEYVLLKKTLDASTIPADIKIAIEPVLNRTIPLIKSGKYAEYETIENYIHWITRIPFATIKTDNVDIPKITAELNQKHFGLQDVKDKIIEYVSVLRLKINQKVQELQSQNAQFTYKDYPSPTTMLFIGIQGVGKTSMVKSIASALGRPFVKISLGGLASVEALKGTDKNKPDAEPGLIVKALINTQTMNPLILLDEIDKISESIRAEVMAALLEILDPEQNYMFSDRYVDFPLDISKCMFVATANNIGGITSALLDRLEIVRFTSYSDQDKIQIAQKYLLPKVLGQSGLNSNQLMFADDVWDLIIRPLGFDAGIRELERTLKQITSKVAREIVEGQSNQVTLSAENFRKYIPEDFGVYT